MLAEISMGKADALPSSRGQGSNGDVYKRQVSGCVVRDREVYLKLYQEACSAEK